MARLILHTLARPFVDRLKASNRQHRRQTRAPQIYGRGEPPSRDGRAHYIILTPSGGIAGRPSTSQLASAVCEIYAIKPDGYLSLLRPSRAVFNLSVLKVPGSQYMPAMQDSSGRLFVDYRPTLAYVTMTQTGGSAGTASTKCSFTYTLTDVITGETLGTTYNPESTGKFNRPIVGACVAADFGFGYKLNQGSNFILVDCNEQLDVEACA